MPGKHTSADHTTRAGFTVAELARRWRCGADKVRAWITRGELPAMNRAASLTGRPRWVISPDAVDAFERRRRSPAPAPPKRRKKTPAAVDFLTDVR